MNNKASGLKEAVLILDNLLILNTLYFTKDPQEKLHLGFIDLTSAYDMVNRDILWKKLEKNEFSRKTNKYPEVIL